MKNKRAFTLLDVLLGLLIMSVVMTSIYALFSVSIRLFQKAKKAGEVYQEARWVFMQITQDIENMRPYDFSGSYPGKLDFSGDSGGISFIRSSGGELKVIRYYLMLPERDKVHQVVVLDKDAALKSIVVSSDEEVYELIREEQSLKDYLQPENESSAVRNVWSSGIRKDGLKFLFGKVDYEGGGALIWESRWESSSWPVMLRIEMGPWARQEVVLAKSVFIPSGFKINKSIVVPKEF